MVDFEDQEPYEYSEIIHWLQDLWAPKERRPTVYFGWAYCKKPGTSLHALSLKVPPYYWAGVKRIPTNESQEFAHLIRVPVSDQQVTVTFDFRKVENIFWDEAEHPRTFLSNQEVFRRDLLEVPKYYYYVEQLTLGTMDADLVKERCGTVVTLDRWVGEAIQLSDLNMNLK